MWYIKNKDMFFKGRVPSYHNDVDELWVKDINRAAIFYSLEHAKQILSSLPKEREAKIMIDPHSFKPEYMEDPNEEETF